MFAPVSKQGGYLKSPLVRGPRAIPRRLSGPDLSRRGTVLIPFLPPRLMAMGDV